MSLSNTSGLFTERMFGKLSDMIRDNRYTILGSLISGFLAYTFMIANKLPNHDELYSLFTKGTTIESGRWGLELVSLLFPDVSIPWLYGVLSILILTIGACMIVRMFSIKSKVLQFLLGGLIIAFPSQIGTFTFMYTATAYAAAFLLSVAVAWLVCKEDKKLHMIAACCMVLSLSIYQAYFAITVSLLILHLFFRLLYDREEAGNVFSKGLYAVLFLIASFLLYWIATKIVWRLSGIGMGDYASSALSLDIRSFAERIGNAYVSFFRILRYRSNSIITTRLSVVIHFLLLGLTGIAAFVFVAEKKKPGQILLLLLLLLMLPLGINSMFLVFQEGSIHTLVLYSYISLYVLFAGMIEYGICTERLQKTWTKLLGNMADLAVMGMAVILASNIYVANKAYLNMHLAYENTYYYTTSILNRLQDTPGYTKESKVAIIGEYQLPDFYYEQFYDLMQLMGTRKLSPNAYSIEGFFELYNGVKINFASAEQKKSLAQSAEFHAMESYPNYGYIQTIDDVIVIKLSDIS